MTLRPLREGDSDALLALLLRLDHETDTMLFEPGERDRDGAAQRRLTERLLSSERDAVFVADPGDALAGFAGVRRNERRRTEHAASLVVGVLPGHQRRGVGGGLMALAEQWARGRGVARVELTVRCDNLAAVSLYLKRGYAVEGLRRRALRVGGRFVDEYAMSLLLDPAGAP